MQEIRKQHANHQIEQLNKMKQKVTKDCAQIHSEIGDVRAATDEVSRSKVGNRSFCSAPFYY